MRALIPRGVSAGVRIIQEIIIVQVSRGNTIRRSKNTRWGPLARGEAKLNPIAEIRSPVSHPPQLLIGVLQPTGFPGFLHGGLPSCVDSAVCGHHDRQQDKPHTYEPQFDSICENSQVQTRIAMEFCNLRPSLYPGASCVL